MNIQVREEEEGSLGFSLLDFVYGFAVFVCIFLVPVIFSAAYRPEIKKGTIRTLVCYPVSPLDITVTKLLYALIIGFIFAYLTFMIPGTTCASSSWPSPSPSSPWSSAPLQPCPWRS
jgi:ABC-type transport system involved in multi-copper enzyme maturation permease subunit